MSFNFRHLKYFVATAELGQVSAAAMQLSISQSAVTAAIKELEAVLGTRLFTRTAQGMTLTEAGRRFLSSAYDILAKVDEALTLLDTESETETEAGGTLTVAASYTVIGYFLPQHLERLSRLLPRLDIRLTELSREMIEEGLIRGHYDLGVVLTSNVSNPDLVQETLLRSPRRLWTAARHPLLARAPVPLEAIAREPYVMLTVDEAAHTAARYWSRTPWQPRVTLRTSSVEAVRSLVANGQGVSILSDMVYRPWSLEGRRLETADVAEEIPAMGIGLAWRRDRSFTPQMQAFLAYFRNACGTQPGRG